MATVTENKNNHHESSKAAMWTKIGTGILGGLLLTLQGVNLSELGNVSEQGKERAESLKAIEHEGQQRAEALKGIADTQASQIKLLEAIQTSIRQNAEIIANGDRMLQHDNTQLDNQSKILELLKKNLEARTKSERSYPPPENEQ